MTRCLAALAVSLAVIAMDLYVLRQGRRVIRRAQPLWAKAALFFLLVTTLAVLLAFAVIAALFGCAGIPPVMF